MILATLAVQGWRNIDGKASWGDNLNIIYGDNGQGKTNWLEAIYLLATTKSFRTQKLQEAVNFNEDLAIVKGQVARTQDVSRQLQVAIQGNTKSLSVNGKRETATEYISQLHVIAFTADDLEIVRGGPEARRRFLDRGIVALNHGYIQTLADYNRVIKQKNRLLQDAQSDELTLAQTRERLQPWNQQLVALSHTIYQSRLDYVERLKEALQRNLFGQEQVSIRYASTLEGKGDLSDYRTLLESRLELRLNAEINAGYALIGTHRDDLEIQLDARQIRTFGSSGQQRSALIILDLAAIEVYYEWHREYPIFIMDDVDAELDSRRLMILLERLQGRTQTFITTTDANLAAIYKDAAAFEIINGKIA